MEHPSLDAETCPDDHFPYLDLSLEGKTEVPLSVLLDMWEHEHTMEENTKHLHGEFYILPRERYIKKCNMVTLFKHILGEYSIFHEKPTLQDEKEVPELLEREEENSNNMEEVD